MPTIKGPIVIKKGIIDAEELLSRAKGDFKVKLPFSATGWKSTKLPKIADLSSIELADEGKSKPISKKDSDKAEIVVHDKLKKEEGEISKILPTKAELESKANELGFTKFREWAKKEYNVTGRSTGGIIDDIIAGKIEL